MTSQWRSVVPAVVCGAGGAEISGGPPNNKIYPTTSKFVLDTLLENSDTTKWAPQTLVLLNFQVLTQKLNIKNG